MLAAIIFFLSGLKPAFSQDTLMLNDGTELHVHIVEIEKQYIVFTDLNTNGAPTRKRPLSDIFMAIYKGGHRETFTSTVPANDNNVASLTKNHFLLKLTNGKWSTGKAGKYRSYTAEVSVFIDQALFANLTIVAYQKNGASSGYENPGGSYFGNNSLSIACQTKRISEMLYAKYESETGKGVGWAIPPGFLTDQAGSCDVAFMQKKIGAKDFESWGGVTARKIPLESCSDLNQRILSVVLLWLRENF